MDVSANLVTDVQLSNWMLNAVGRSQANQDEWCYAIAQLTGVPCPAYDIGNGPTVQTDATTFLNGLRNYQLTQNAGTQGPGGSSSTATAATPSSNAAPTQAAIGAGLLGPTNCQFCIWLRKNIVLVAILAGVVIYFGFYYKK